MDTNQATSSYNLEHDLKSRGVADAEELPDYHYRDDARLVNAVIMEFVESIIRYFYESDEDVSGDFELKAWLAELAHPEEGNLRDFPETLASVDALIDLLTTIIFTASAGHSSTNSGQYDMYGYIPNAPGEMKSPPPTTREPLSEQKLAAALPKGKDAADQIATAHLLSVGTESPLGFYHPRFFAGYPAITAMVLHFEKRLREVSSLYPSVEI